MGREADGVKDHVDMLEMFHLVQTGPCAVFCAVTTPCSINRVTDSARAGHPTLFSLQTGARHLFLLVTYTSSSPPPPPEVHSRISTGSSSTWP
jgi:hypothetical protein